MTILAWIVLGLVAGAIAKALMPGRDPGGIIVTMLIGIVGAFLGGWILSPLVGGGTINQADFSVLGLLVSLGGAVGLLAIVNLVRRGATR